MTTLVAGFADPVRDAQAAFRDALQALSRPGLVVECEVAVPPLGLMPAGAALLLALTDHETPVWWQRNGGLSDWLRFHTGAPPAAAPQEAAFALIADAATVSPLAAFGAGSDEEPDASATLLIELPSLDAGPPTTWSGPGIQGTREVRLALPRHFWSQWSDNHSRFPRGVDVLFVCGTRLVGLPRTTRVEEAD